MADEPKPRNIYQRVQDVMREVSYVRKEEKKVNNQYRFVSHDAVAAKIHEANVKHGIVVVPSIIPESVKRDGNRVELLLRSTFVNADDPADRFEVTFLGEGIDPQDKGGGKAMSYATKYTLLKVYMLETGDDPENDDINHDPTAKPPAKTFVPKYQKAAKDPLPPAGDPADALGKAPFDQLVESSKTAADSLRRLETASTVDAIEAVVKGITLIAGKLVEVDKVKLREAVAAARLRVAAKPYVPPADLQARLLGELEALKSQLGPGMFGTLVLKHMGDPEAKDLSLGTDGLKNLRDEAMKAVGP